MYFRLLRFRLMRQILVEDNLSGTHLCSLNFRSTSFFWAEMAWVLGTAWEIIALCLAVWIAVKHFRELQRVSTGWTVGDCFKILIETHVFYFARWARNSNVAIFSHSRSALVLLLFLAFSSASTLQNSLYANLPLTSASDKLRSCHTRAQIPWNLRFLSTSFQLPKLCRCLYWDHALSLESESIMLSLWPTPMKQLAWLQLFSKIAYTLKPAVVSSARNSVHTPNIGCSMGYYYIICLGCRYIFSSTELCLSI